MVKAETATAELVHLNGVDGATGEYLSSPLAPDELAELLDSGVSDLLTPRDRRPTFGVDPQSLESSGWGVLFARDADPRVYEALEPLLRHRRAQVGEGSSLYREIRGDEGYVPGESTSALMARLGVGPGAVAPTKAPYYLLLVGGPEEIPYAVQYGIDLSFAVGRVSFETPEEYARYAAGVVAAETGKVRRPRRVSFLAPRHDEATRMSCHGLARPLARYLEEQVARDGWEVAAHLAEDAGKRRFADVLGGAETPALAFTASHGVRFAAGDPRQREEQGALLCQEWPGPGGGEVAEASLLGARDVGDDADPGGLVSFHFACYGAGWPARDDFAHRVPDRSPSEVAPEPMVAALPRRLLGHPRGSALAVVGHVDRAWGWSYAFGHDYHREVFEATLAEIVTGYRIGAAMERFGERHGQLAGMLAMAWQRKRDGLDVDRKEYVDLLTATHDARNYVILGDPAVRLAVDWGQEEG